MSQPDDPYKPYQEVVDIGTMWSSKAVTLIYNPVSEGFRAEDGTITKKCVKIRVASNTGTTYIVTRHHRGNYKANSWFTWVHRRR